MIIQGTGTDISHVSALVLFLGTKIKGRTIQLRRSCSLKDSVPVGSGNLGNRRKNLTDRGRKQTELPVGEIHINFYAGDQLSVCQGFCFLKKFHSLVRFGQHGHGGVNRLVEKLLIIRKRSKGRRSIHHILHHVLDHRRCFGGGVLLLPDGVGNDHIIKFSIKENSQHQDRNGYRQHQGKREFRLELHISVYLSDLKKKSLHKCGSFHCDIFSLYSEGERPVYFLKLFPK